MNEIKAYVRRSQVNRVVASLERAGAPGITLVEVHPVGYGYEPNYFEAQFDDAWKRYRLWQVVKLEVVCADEDTDWLSVERLPVAPLHEEQCLKAADSRSRSFL